MIDVKQKQEEVLKENFNLIAERINTYYKKKQAFILRDLLTDEEQNSYYIYSTKGILLALMNSGHIEIISTYNGYKNFVYMPKEHIKFNIYH